MKAACVGSVDFSAIRDVLANGLEIPAKYGRRGKAKAFHFARRRAGSFYKQKRVEVFYALENDIMATVTVYVFYGEWKEENADHV